MSSSTYTSLLYVDIDPSVNIPTKRGPALSVKLRDMAQRYNVQVYPKKLTQYDPVTGAKPGQRVFVAAGSIEAAIEQPDCCALPGSFSKRLMASESIVAASGERIDRLLRTDRGLDLVRTVCEKLMDQEYEVQAELKVRSLILGMTRESLARFALAVLDEVPDIAKDSRGSGTFPERLREKLLSGKAERKPQERDIVSQIEALVGELSDKLGTRVYPELTMRPGQRSLASWWQQSP